MNRLVAGKELHLARVAAKQGKLAEAAATAKAFEERWKRNPNDVGEVHLASVYAALGERDRAFAWLDRALDARKFQADLFEPALFGSIRADPRFGRMLERMYRIEDEELGRGVSPAAEDVPR